MSENRNPDLAVPRVTHDAARPWQIPSGVPVIVLRDSCSGAACRLRTEVAVFRDETYLSVLFSMEDDEIVATMRERDAELWREDVVEVFVAPCRLDSYFEFEVSPIGTLFDARVSFPGPTRETMSLDTSWNCPGFHALVRRRPDREPETIETLVRIPFGCLGIDPPSTGDEWRANFHRIDRSPRGDSFAAWSPTRTLRPDFHVPAKFGTIVF